MSNNLGFLSALGLGIAQLVFLHHLEFPSCVFCMTETILALRVWPWGLGSFLRLYISAQSDQCFHVGALCVLGGGVTPCQGHRKQTELCPWDG